MAYQHGEQSVPKRRHQHRGNDRETPQGKVYISIFYLINACRFGCSLSFKLFTAWILSQDYQEEITLAEENKSHLNELGERLARASHRSKAAEIEQKLSKVSDRWQHLLDLVGAR